MSGLETGKTVETVAKTAVGVGVGGAILERVGSAGMAAAGMNLLAGAGIIGIGLAGIKMMWNGLTGGKK